jgi:hypothetical protein
MDRIALKALSTSLIADAPPSNITAQDMRDLNDEIIPSNATISDLNTFTGETTFSGIVTINNKLDTSYQASLPIQSQTDLKNINGNFAWLSGSPDTINTFGEAPEGAIRYLLFYDPCIISNNTEIICIGNQLINVESGDTCILIGEGSSVWRMVSYLRKTGLPLSASNNTIWTVSDVAPTLNESAPTYLRGSRWISKENGGTTRKEWILDDDTFPVAIWNPMAGSFGQWGDGKTLEIDTFGNAFPLSNLGDSTIQYELSYIRINKTFTIQGYLQITYLAGTSGFVSLPFDINNQGLQFNSQTVNGFGVLWVNGEGVNTNHYKIRIDSQKISVEDATGFPFNCTFTILFQLNIDLQ